MSYRVRIFEETIFEVEVTFWEADTGNDGNVKLKVNFGDLDEDMRREALAAIDMAAATAKAKIEAA